jgi:hypothetical protein
MKQQTERPRDARWRRNKAMSSRRSSKRSTASDVKSAGSGAEQPRGELHQKRSCGTCVT